MIRTAARVVVVAIARTGATRSADVLLLGALGVSGLEVPHEGDRVGEAHVAQRTHLAMQRGRSATGGLMRGLMRSLVGMRVGMGMVRGGPCSCSGDRQAIIRVKSQNVVGQYPLRLVRQAAEWAWDRCMSGLLVDRRGRDRSSNRVGVPFKLFVTTFLGFLLAVFVFVTAVEDPSVLSLVALLRGRVGIPHFHVLLHLFQKVLADGPHTVVFVGYSVGQAHIHVAFGARELVTWAKYCVTAGLETSNHDFLAMHWGLMGAFVKIVMIPYNVGVLRLVKLDAFPTDGTINACHIFCLRTVTLMSSIRSMQQTQRLRTGVTLEG